MKPHTLLRLYPKPWRERYGGEFVALLEKEGTGPRVVMSVAAGAFDAWMSPKTPTEMALDGPFGPGILLEQNMDVEAREWVTYIALSVALGCLFYVIAGVFTDRAYLAFPMAAQTVMPFLWFRYFSLRTRVAAAFWGLAAFLVFVAGFYIFLSLVL